MLQDREGRLWFGTEGSGVTRWDGSSWTVFGVAEGLPNSRVKAIHEDRAGDFWFITDGSITRFHEGVWTHFDLDSYLNSSRFNSIAEDHSGNLWFVVDGATLYRHDGIEPVRIQNVAGLGFFDSYTVLVDQEGTVWVGTDRGLLCFDGTQWRLYTTSDGLAENTVYSSLQDRNGNLWFGTGNGVSRFDPVGWSSFTPSNSPLSGSGIRAVLEDRDGRFWFTTEYTGVNQYDPTTGVWKRFTMNDGLVSDLVWDVLQDREGGFWFACNSSSGGLTHYDPRTNTWSTFRHSSAGDLYYHQVLEDSTRGVFWVASSNGVARYSPQSGRWDRFTAANGLPLDGTFVGEIYLDHSANLWVTTSGGVARYDGSAWSPFPPAGGSLVSSSVLQDRLGNYWFGTNRGALRYEPSTGVSRIYRPAWDPTAIDTSLINSSVGHILEDHHGVLWCNAGGNLGRIDDDGFPLLTTDDGLSGPIESLIEDRHGRLWMGTAYGVSTYEPERVSPQAVFFAQPSSLLTRSTIFSFMAAWGAVSGIQFSYRLDGTEWSSWSEINFQSVSGLADGMHTFEVRARDRLHLVSPWPAVARFEVDATPPAPVIVFPGFGQVVRGTVAVRGSASDPRFDHYRVEVRQSGADSWERLLDWWAPVANGTLARWDTAPEPDGVYELRLSVTDSLGLTGTAQVSVVVDNHFPFVEETSPAVVTATSGGNAYTTNQELHLYFPPHAFDQDALVSITPADSVPDTLPSGAIRILPSYEIAWSSAPLRKPAILEFSTAGKASGPGVHAIYFFSAGNEWQRLGGTAEEGKLSLAVREPGRYALFAEAASSGGVASLSTLSFTPRVFSVADRFANDHVAIGFTLGRPAPVTVRIYNRAGRLVREVISGQTMGAGANLIRWDGRDRAEVYVADGIYLVTVEALGQTRRSTLAVVR